MSSARYCSTNQVIVGAATVELRSGINATATNGGTLVSTLQVTNGTFNFPNVAAGIYTLISKATGYTDATRTGIVAGGTAGTGQDLILSPVGAGVTGRVVLTWGASPDDLDSHLTGPVSGNATRFWIY